MSNRPKRCREGRKERAGAGFDNLAGAHGQTLREEGDGERVTPLGTRRLPDPGEVAGRAEGEAQARQVVRYVSRPHDAGAGLVNGAPGVLGDTGVGAGVDAALDGRKVGRELALLGRGEVASGGSPLPRRRAGAGLGGLFDHGFQDGEERGRRARRREVGRQSAVCDLGAKAEGAPAAAVNRIPVRSRRIRLGNRGEEAETA